MTTREEKIQILNDFMSGNNPFKVDKPSLWIPSDDDPDMIRDLVSGKTLRRCELNDYLKNKKSNYKGIFIDWAKMD